MSKRNMGRFLLFVCVCVATVAVLRAAGGDGLHVPRATDIVRGAQARALQGMGLDAAVFSHFVIGADGEVSLILHKSRRPAPLGSCDSNADCEAATEELCEDSGNGSTVFNVEITEHDNGDKMCSATCGAEGPTAMVLCSNTSNTTHGLSDDADPVGSCAGPTRMEYRHNSDGTGAWVPVCTITEDPGPFGSAAQVEGQ